jgi:antitoxin ParD1/3/4
LKTVVITRVKHGSELPDGKCDLLVVKASVASKPYLQQATDSRLFWLSVQSYGIKCHPHSGKGFTMATHNVVVPNPMEQSIDELVKTGRYQNFSEVVRAGLRMLLEREAEETAKLEALRNATSIGLMQLDRGEFEDIDPSELETYLETLGRQASRGI